MNVWRPAEHCLGPPATPAPPEARNNGFLSPPEQVDEGLDLPPREPELPIWRSSLSSWFQSDVDVFFHAVSIYSRWRPDLIADAVKTKSEVEVVEFLITLDSCTSPRETGTDQGIYKIAPISPAAIEVSEKWVAAEEAIASAITAQEENGELEKRHARKIAAWKREDLLKKLDDLQLQVLDSILRGDAEAQKEKGLTCESADASDPDTGVGLKALSPMSQRRLTKRLYMRRKRAQLRGEAEVTVDLEKMKPGRKVGGRGKEKSGSVVEEKSRKSRYQKVRDEFENAGIDASYLRKHDMDLFHYGPLGKLVGSALIANIAVIYSFVMYRTFKPLVQCPEDDISASYISADLVQYLQASVVAFTTDVVHRAILWKEQANELKHQKVWRGGMHQVAVVSCLLSTCQLTYILMSPR